MDDLTKIKNIAKAKNYTRKHQYLILAELTGVTPEQAKQVCSLQRTIRFAIPADEVGLKKCQEWKRPQWMIAMDNEVNHLFKNL